MFVKVPETMMKLTATAALGALILAASAAPAFAGGYWDGGIVQSGQGGDPQPGYYDRDCPCYCPSDRQGHDQRWGDADDRGWSGGNRYYRNDRDTGDVRYSSDERVYDSGWQDQDAYQDQGDYQDEDNAPADYSDSGYEVGPYGYYDDAGGGGFAGGSAFANVGVDLDFSDRFRDRDRFHDHDQFHDHDMMHHDDHQHMMMHHEDRYPQHQSYQPHMGQWGSPMQPYHQMQPHYSMAPRVSGYSHPMAMHRSGGGGRRR
jgi:hypothetical protein